MKLKSILVYILYNLLFWLPDKIYISILYLITMGKFMNWKNPITYNEKLNWMKLYNRRPEYTIMVDKYAVKEYVANIIGEQYIIPTIGVWNKPTDVDLNDLPHAFVLKTTSGGGNTGVVICHDKQNFNFNDAIKRLQHSLDDDIYIRSREWPYKNIQKKIIAEPLMVDDGEQELIDYKFFAFNGRVQALFVATDRSSGDVKFDFFDRDFKPLDIVQSHSKSSKKISRPRTFDTMIKIAEKLSQGIPHVRVDLYEINGLVYFSELTFFHHGGITPFYPKEWDKIFGSWITLPNKY